MKSQTFPASVYCYLLSWTLTGIKHDNWMSSKTEKCVNYYRIFCKQKLTSLCTFLVHDPVTTLPTPNWIPCLDFIFMVALYERDTQLGQSQLSDTKTLSTLTTANVNHSLPWRFLCHTCRSCCIIHRLPGGRLNLLAQINGFKLAVDRYKVSKMDRNETRINKTDADKSWRW